MIIAFILNSLLVCTVVLIHHEMLYRLSQTLPKLPVRHHFRIVFGVFGSLVAHVIEICIFAVAFYLMIQQGSFGELTGNTRDSLLDCIYYSFTTYTSLGFGDIVPFGPIRFLTGLEALTGLVLITWTASFMYIEMEKNWQVK